MNSYQPGRAVGIAGIPSLHQGLGAGYPVSLPIFEGPLDLLLHLIEQEKLDISEVSLVAVTDQYLQTIDQLEELVPGALADFLLVASRLLYIKSTRLLPRPPSDDDEEEETGESLVQRLLEYRRFKRVAEALRELDEENARAFARTPSAVDLAGLPQRLPDFGDLDSGLLQKALQRALRRIPVAPPPPEVKPYTVTVAERIETVRERLARLQGPQASPDQPVQLSFIHLLEETQSRIEVIVTFLAVLELVKQRVVEAYQESTFGEIVIRPVTDAAPPAVEPEGPESEDPLLDESISAAAQEEERAAEKPSPGETEQPEGE